MSENINVINRLGESEPIDLNKIHKVVSHATEGVTGVSPSEIEIKAHLNFYDGMPTTEIQELIVKAAAELISEETPNYDIVAGRLLNFDLRKRVYGQFEPVALKRVIYRNTFEYEVYSKEIWENYSESELDELGEYIKHDRDNNFRYAGMLQELDKYLVQNRKEGIHYETPQVRYAMIALTGFMFEDKGKRMSLVKEFYDVISMWKAGLATPVQAGLGTKVKQFSSCVVVDTDDSLDSIIATVGANIKYVSRKAGLGNNIGRIRPEHAPVRGGDVVHTGLIPFIKLLKASVKSCSMGGLRGGAMTLHYPLWHTDIEKLLVLKNNKGTEETRERHIDYSLQANKYLFNRLIRGENISLFSPQITGLYESFFSADSEEFVELYEKLEADPLCPRKTIPAKKLWDVFVNERSSTGRIYLQMVDEVNFTSPFYDPIYMSNLCQEIGLPTVPFQNEFDEHGRIALCTLANINWGAFSNPEDMERTLYLLVRFLDNLLSYQDYPLIQARKAVEEYRPLGIGINNLAYWIAKNGFKYSDGSSLEELDRWGEHYFYYLQKATIALAKERGSCGKETTRHDGVMITDTQAQAAIDLTKRENELDWDVLRELAMKYGVRNATVAAQMPSESNSIVFNSTNGLEPVRSLVTLKKNRNSIMPIVVPSIQKLKNKYELLWDMKDPAGYIDVCSIVQKWTDQAISVNTSYNPNHYPDNKVPTKLIYANLHRFIKQGGKNLYYNNTMDDVELDPTKLDEKPDDDCCKL